MLKIVLLFAVNLMLINVAHCQNIDAPIFYFKYNSSGKSVKVSILDTADFYRIILPPDEGDILFNVKEFYKNKQLKFVGKTDPRPVDILLPFFVKFHRRGLFK